MKNARHQQILDLIRNEQIETQEELADRLKEAGFPVTQATISRDIRQLSLRKVGNASGKSYYTTADPPGDFAVRYQRVLKETFVSLDISVNLAVVKTASGMAMAAAAAIDAFDWPEVLGCIAGDDTILIVLRDPEDAQAFRKRMESLS